MNENAETQQEYFGKVNIKQNDFKTSYYNLLSKYADLEQQLTEAKELLKQWLQTTQANGCDNINIVADTQAFLKE